jgi:hypothetical protein
MAMAVVQWDSMQQVCLLILLSAFHFYLLVPTLLDGSPETQKENHLTRKQIRFIYTNTKFSVTQVTWDNNPGWNSENLNKTAATGNKAMYALAYDTDTNVQLRVGFGWAEGDLAELYYSSSPWWRTWVWA